MQINLLKQNSGFRPIGVGKIICGLIGNHINKRIKNNLRFLGGDKQPCLGRKCRIDYAFLFVRSQLEKPENEAVLLIDAQKCLQLPQT